MGLLFTLCTSHNTMWPGFCVAACSCCTPCSHADVLVAHMQSWQQRPRLAGHSQLHHGHMLHMLRMTPTAQEAWHGLSACTHADFQQPLRAGFTPNPNSRAWTQRAGILQGVAEPLAADGPTSTAPAWLASQIPPHKAKPLNPTP